MNDEWTINWDKKVIRYTAPADSGYHTVLDFHKYLIELTEKVTFSVGMTPTVLVVPLR